MEGHIRRLLYSALLAFFIAFAFYDGSPLLYWVLGGCWAVTFCAWTLWSRWRMKVSPRRDESKPQNPPCPLWLRLLRKTLTVIASAVAVIVIMMASVSFVLGRCARQARIQRDKIRAGMTVEQVLPLVQGAFDINAHAMLPENISDEHGVHYVTLIARSDGSFAAIGEVSQLEALPLLKQKMSDGYEWRWRYTFINITPQHFSFTVTFDRNGRVKDVTDVWGWD